MRKKKVRAKLKIKVKAKKRIKRVECPECGGAVYRLSMVYDGTYGCETCKGRKTVTKKILDLYNARKVLSALIKKGDRL